MFVSDSKRVCQLMMAETLGKPIADDWQCMPTRCTFAVPVLVHGKPEGSTLSLLGGSILC